jgi:hypothetical protein
MDAKSDIEAIQIESTKNSKTKPEEAKPLTNEPEKAIRPVQPKPKQATTEKFTKPFEYNTTDERDKKQLDKNPKPAVDKKSRFTENKPRHKMSSSVDKGKIETDTKSLNFKTKKYSDNSSKGTSNTMSTLANSSKEHPRFRHSIKKESIKLKNKVSSAKPKKKRRPRSNDDRKKDKYGYYFDETSRKKVGSRGVSEKGSKDSKGQDGYKRRNFVNNKTNGIDSRNVYANDNNKKKDWNSASLNLKQYVRKSDLSLFYAQKSNPKQKKSVDPKLENFRSSGLAKSAEHQFKSYMKNEKQNLANPYFSGNSDFYKSFGSSTYNPINTSGPSGKKLASLKNNLAMNTISGKAVDSKNTSYNQHMKAMKKIEKKSIKFVMKNQNLSYQQKPSTALNKSHMDKMMDLSHSKAKKRSTSPMTKNIKGVYRGPTDVLLGLSKPKSRSGSRKTNMRPIGNYKIY